MVNFWKYIDRFENVKNRYYWTSQRPSDHLGDCQFLYDFYDEFHEYTIDVLLKWKYNIWLIDTHNVTFDRNTIFYGDDGGCHFREGNESDIVGKYTYQVFLNSLCNQGRTRC